MKKTVLKIMLAMLLASIMTISVFAAESFLSEANQHGLRFDYTGNLGYEFTLNHSVTVTALGRPENLEDGGTQYEHTLYIWDIDTETLLASAVIGPESPIDDKGFRTAQLETPVTLYVGMKYAITSTEEAGGDCWYDIGTAPDGETLAVTDVATVTKARFTGTVDAFPASTGTGRDEGDGYVGPTFYYELSDALPPERELVYITPDAPVSALTEAAQGPRADFTGSLGYSFTVRQDIVVTSLARPSNPDFGGMNQEHTLYIWDVASQEIIATALVTPDTPIDALGFHAVQLEEPVTLVEDTEYIVCSDEFADGDCWYDIDSLGKTPNDGVMHTPSELIRMDRPKFASSNGAFPSSTYNPPEKNEGYVGVSFYYYTVAQQEVVEEPVVEEPVVETPAVEEPVVEEPVVEEPVVEETVEAPAEPAAPQTSDNTLLICALSIICLVSAGAVVSTKIRA